MSQAHYANVSAQADFPAIERSVLAYWKQDGTFQASIARRHDILHEAAPNAAEPVKEYVFYDGPPFANGLPHYGHLLTGYVKDIIPRFQTMRGRLVERRFGWDCHGLPAEMEAEKTLKISGRANIQAYGIAKFNAHCKESVLRYTSEWRDYVERQARWVDFEGDYKTLDLSYMESVIWAFKELWKKGLIYEGRRVVPYSWGAQTPLSNFELRLDDSYRPRQDPALTVKFRLRSEEPSAPPTYLLIWTTTPWTLPSNLGVACHPDIDYVEMDLGSERVILAEATLPAYAKELKGAVKLRTFKGAELVEKTYEPLFPYYANHPNSFRVLAGDFVSMEDGTGLVHLAPGFGEDDQRVCEANGIELVCPVDEAGRFEAPITDWLGINVFEANKPIIRRVLEMGHLFKQATCDHSYPHCWRTDTPIIYRAIPSWYVRVTEFRDRMVAHNQDIRWIPEHIRDGQFGKWLENARDWSISRNRFWGSPIPVWKSDNPQYERIDVYGSLDEIERDFGVRPDDLHRPFVDELVRPNPDDPTGKSMMRRVSEVFDCWFESGAMPFAQVHYPFEKKAWFEQHFPADFVVEYIGQTRGWFYTMVVLATALFDKPPFRNVMCHGVVLDSQGQKLSKKLRNYPDPLVLCEKHGADALRWSLVSTAILRGSDLQIDKDGQNVAEVVRLVLNPIWNAYYFFTLYANSDGIMASKRFDSQNSLDRYVLAKARQLVERTTLCLDNYDVPGACSEISAYLEAMNNWYIRRSRPRFWRRGHDADKQAAYDTLYTVLTVLCQITAPLLPLLSEEVYRGLTGERSVHLCDWPSATELPQDDALVASMDRARDVCSTVLSLRESKRLRVRLPLQSLTVAGRVDGLADFVDLIRDEVNVKEVRLVPDVSGFASYNLKVKANVIAGRLGGELKNVLASARAGKWERLADGRIQVGQTVLEAKEAEFTLAPNAGMVGAALSNQDAVCVVDVEITPALRNEGLARDLVRAVQQGRKKMDLLVSDPIDLVCSVSQELSAALEPHKAYIAEQTLSSNLTFGSVEGFEFTEEVSLERMPVTFGIRKHA